MATVSPPGQRYAEYREKNSERQPGQQAHGRVAQPEVQADRFHQHGKHDPVHGIGEADDTQDEQKPDTALVHVGNPSGEWRISHLACVDLRKRAAASGRHSWVGCRTPAIRWRQFANGEVCSTFFFYSDARPECNVEPNRILAGEWRLWRLADIHDWFR